jgi:hypothetical protein
LFSDRGIAGHHRDLIDGKSLCDALGQGLRECRRQLRWLQNGPISCRQRADQRRQRELQRVVPRTNNPNHAERLTHDYGSSRAVGKRRRRAARLHPARKISHCVTNAALQKQRLSNADLYQRACAKIARNRSGRFLGVRFDQRAQALQSIQAHSERGRHVELEGILLNAQQCPQVVDERIGERAGGGR